MLELVDNLLQFTVTLIACMATGKMYYKSRKQAYFLLACFYLTFTLGALNWTLHLLLFRYSPQVFYVSDLAWIASFMFLLTLEYTFSTSDERRFQHFIVWLVPIIIIPQFLLYLSHGEVITNLLMCGITMVIAWYSVRGLLYARKQNGKHRNMQYFHIAVLCIVALEYCLWTSSCFWVSDTFSNPYFWFDFLLTASLFALLPATKKAVE